MKIILFDDSAWDNLLPLTFTRPVSDLRVGILTIRQKWESALGQAAGISTRAYLQQQALPQGQDSLYINSGLLPEAALVEKLLALKPAEALYAEEKLLACRTSQVPTELGAFAASDFVRYPLQIPFSCLHFPWDMFRLNGQEIERDFERITARRQSESLSSSNRIIGSGEIFIEPGARVECCIFNTSAGPVYVGKDAEIMEGCMIRGPFALCDEAVVKMGAKIYGPTTIGPYSKVGGEINNSILQACSNKAHDGFLGNSVVGQWCNLGADTNNSNLKNNYAEVKMWNYPSKRFITTGLQFCGLIMGDHSKAGINTMFNTGTVVGMSANIYGDGFPRNFIPSFSWGGAAGFKTFEPDKALDVAELVMKRRNIELTARDRMIFQHVFEQTATFRRY